MKIHFCDLCNESVPQADLDQGRAFIRKDRVICSTCENVMSHGSPPATATASVDVAPALPNPAVIVASGPTASHPHVSHLQPIVVRSAGSSGLLVALLGLVFTAGVMFVLDNRIRDIQEDAGIVEKSVAKHQNELERIDRSGALTSESLRDFEKKDGGRIEKQRADTARLVDQVAELGKQQNDLSARIAGLTVLVNKHEAKAGSGDIELQQRLLDLSARIAKGEDDLSAVTARLLTIEMTPPPAPAVAEPAKVESTEATWTAQLDGLKSDNNSVRWEAVTGLGATKDPAVVPHLLPMLKDTDVFVRMAAARVLGEMQAKPAVGALIDGLEDPETAVREAAFIALRGITGKDLKFDPQAVDAERAKRVKAWRDWWKKEGEGATTGT